jgi:hypothetical protein
MRTNSPISVHVAGILIVTFTGSLSVFSKLILSHVAPKLATMIVFGNNVLSTSFTSGRFNIQVKTSLLEFLIIVQAGICTSILFLSPEDCIIKADNTLPRLSLVLILFFHTRKLFKLGFMLLVQLLYQLAISSAFISKAEETFGKSIISVSES